MSAADDHIPEHEGDDLVAAEYVLGVLPDEERRQAARRIETDAAFARLVDQWEVRLSPMAAGYEDAPPPAAAKAAIDRRLFGQTEASGPGLWASLAFWRGLAAAAVAALAIMLVVQFLPPAGEAPGERLVASLSHDDTDVHYFVVYDARTADVGLSHVTGARADGRDFELWVIDGDKPPASVGIIPVGSSVHIRAAEQIRRAIEAGAVFAISLEPQGGSPTGEPTGPVVAVGDLREI